MFINDILLIKTMKMTKPNLEDFTLLKVKLINGGGIEIHYKTEDSDGTNIYVEDSTSKLTKIPHPDLTTKLKAAVPYIAQVWGLTVFKTVVADKNFQATKPQVKLTEKAVLALMEQIKVTGISLSGKGENKGVIITGTKTADSKMVMAMNSHRIKFGTSTWGFEAELEDLCKFIEEECYLYLYDGKAAQLEMFGNESSE